MAYVFGPFLLNPVRQQLFEDGKPIRLGGRALDILTTLVLSAGELLTKQELVAAAWPSTFVGETSLRVHIAAIRRALRDDPDHPSYIANVAGRGYRFVAPVREVEDDVTPSSLALPASADALPAAPERLVGRQDAIGTIAAALGTSRLVTIVGPGGIGKTTTAVAVARELAGSYADGAHFIDLSPISDPSFVASALVSRLGIDVRSDAPIPELAAAVAGRRMLFVLDCCEHVIENAARLVEALLEGTREVRVLATSREPLRSEGEHVYRLPPLATPPEETRTASEALQSPAVQLFARYAAATSNGFVLSDEDAPLLAQICRRLDGIPLAIELAATRYDAFGLATLNTIIDERLLSLTGGRRAALPRHRTLGATLDWSYDLLTEGERAVFARLGIFAGRFELNAAIGVGKDENLPEGVVVGAIANLVSKSLVGALREGHQLYYRMSDTTRAYALERLRSSGDHLRVIRRHADHLCAELLNIRSVWASRPKSQWLETLRGQVNDVRAALDWAFSPAGDVELGLELTIASELLWMQLSLLEEGRARVQLALTALVTKPSDGRAEMQLLAALGWLLLQARGPVPEVRDAWERVESIAERRGDRDYLSTANIGRWIYHFNVGDFRKSLELAQRFRTETRSSTDHGSSLIFVQEQGQSLHILGEHKGARQHLEWVLGQYRDEHQRRDDTRLVHDQRSSARSFLARCLWLEGRVDEAMDVLRLNIADKATQQDVLTLANALIHGCPVAFGLGDVAETERLLGMLRDVAVRYGLAPWLRWGRGFEARLLIEDGKVEAGVRVLRSVLLELRGLAFEVYVLENMGALADGLGRLGQLEEAETVIDAALKRCEATDELWCLPDLLRVKAEIALIQDGGAQTGGAEVHYRSALDVARMQGALWWELRNATGFARMLVRQGRVGEGKDLLTGILARVTQGRGARDVLDARALLMNLDALSPVLGPRLASPLPN